MKTTASNKRKLMKFLLGSISAFDEGSGVVSLSSSEAMEAIDSSGMDVDALATFNRLRIQKVTGTEYESVEPCELISDNAFIRDKPLRDLLDRLSALGKGGETWISEICSSPAEIVAWFQGAETMEDFYFRNNLDNPFEETFRLQILKDFSKEIDVNYICLVGLYPSGALRSLPCVISRSDSSLLVKVKDPILLWDPDEDQSTEDIKSFAARVTIFAVQCPT